VIKITDMVQLNIRVPTILKEDAVGCAEKHGYKDLSEFVREAIRLHIYAIEGRERSSPR